MTDNTKMKEIVSGDEEAILVELAEECCELGQAALKLMRIRCHRSPANEERTRESLIEEMADVQVMLGAVRELLTPAKVLGMRATIKYKQKRMRERLEGNGNAAD